MKKAPIVPPSAFALAFAAHKNQILIAAAVLVVIVIGGVVVYKMKMNGPPNAADGSSASSAGAATPQPIASVAPTPMVLGNMPSNTPLPASGVPGQSITIGRITYIYATRGQNINAGCAVQPCNPIIAQATGWKALTT